MRAIIKVTPFRTSVIHSHSLSEPNLNKQETHNKILHGVEYYADLRHLNLEFEVASL